MEIGGSDVKWFTETHLIRLLSNLDNVSDQNTVSNFGRFRETAKSDYQLRRACLSVRILLTLEFF
jgi:hypothetical protein